MIRAWSKERKWECSNTERQFEKLLQEHGYVIDGYREYNSKTDYKITKDGISIVWCIHHEKGVSAVGVFNAMVRYYDIMVEYTKLKETAGGK